MVTIRIIAILVATLATTSAQVVDPAVPDIVLATVSPVNTPMEIAYNPNFDLYYSVPGGNSSVPIWTYDGTSGATVLRTPNSLHDWRGLWWNSDLNQLEGNGCSSCPQVGIWVPDLNASGHALGSGSLAQPTNQPDFQAQGDWDWDDNEVIYYEGGQIYRVDRVANNSLPTIPVSGIPGGGGVLNVNLVGYTGVPGNEYLVWDFMTSSAHFIDKATGAYASSSLVSGAPATSSSWNVGYSNGRIFIWNGSGWNSYIVNVSQIGVRAEIVSVDSPDATVVAGLGGYLVTMTVSNLGSNPIDLSAASLSFTGTADRTSEYTVTPAPANPTQIAPMGMEVLSFDVDVDLMATRETITLDGQIEVTDTVTMSMRTLMGAMTIDRWDVTGCTAPDCGDCNGDLVLSILDALTAARHSAGLIVLTGADFSNCNVIGALEPDPMADVDVLDALSLAQSAAGLPVMLVCC